MSLRVFLGALGALFCAFTSPALSQSINMDIGSFNAQPSSAYGGAAGQAGAWNQMTAAAPLSLVNTAGAATSVSVSASVSFDFTFGFNNANTTGNDELLLDDGHDGALTLDFSGLAPGYYNVYTYAWAPDARTTSFTNVNVPGSTSPPQIVGGADWTGTHVLGVTYAKHPVIVSTGTLQVVCSASSGFVTVNGVQIEYVPHAINMDIGGVNAQPTSAYGAAAGQAGAWNLMTAAAPLSLVNTAGAATSVSVSASVSVNFTFGFNNANTTGNDELLLDDGHDGDLTLDFSGLAPGYYNVYTYAWAPDARTTSFTNVSVPGSTSPPQIVGGANWTGAHILGITYAKHPILVSTGTLQVVCGISSGFVTINGVQIEPVPMALNIDIGSVNAQPTSAYGGAASQVGVWNQMTSAAPLSLLNTGGAVSGASVTASSSVNFGFGFDNLNTTGDDALLLDDGHDGNLTLDFSGLASGSYDVYTYAWAPDARTTFFTTVSVPGSTSPPQIVGGADWTGSHVLGVTYARHAVTVTGGTLQVVCAAFAGASTINGVQIVPSDPDITTYCTSKLTSNGCSPSMSASGMPSASAGNGFLVKGTGFINNKNCLLFYGVSGQAAAPFQGGTLCVGAPIKRTPGTNTFGNPAPNDCSGVPSIDMNLFAVGGLGGTPLPALTVVGTVVNCQWWGRDPGYAAPNNTQLSNGLQYTVGN